MAVNTITYANKVNLNENSGIAEINKITDANMNEIKSVVNNNATELSNLKPVLLWTNPSPSTEISSNTSITLNSDNYDFILWIFRVSISNNQTDSDFSLKGYGLRHYIGNVYRTITRNSDTSYTINASSDAAYNNAAIPLYAIGYKIGLF